MATQGRIHTTTSAARMRRGETRARGMKLDEGVGYEVRERDITPYELMTADEAFLTGTMAEVVPVVKIHGVAIAEGKPGPVTKEIIRGFQRIIQDPTEGVPIRETISIPAKARTN